MKDGIFVQHGFFKYRALTKHDIITRYSMIKHRKDGSIPHKKIDLPKQFERYLALISGNRMRGEFVEFTYGVDEKNKIHALAVVHKQDNFNRKIGNSIVRGRIKRERGDLGRPKYVDKMWIYNELAQ